MKRIVFLSKEENIKFEGIEVIYESFENLKSIDEDALYIVSSPEGYKKVKECGSDALIYVKEAGEMDLYSGATYFVMDIEEAEPIYFERVYQRIHDLPWTMIETDRLILRETLEEDVDEFVKIYANPKMTEYTDGLYEDINEEKKYLREYRDKVYATQGFGIWTVIRKSDGKIIGRAGLSAREGFENFELGFLIGCDYQRQGYATEAILGICSFAVKEDLGKLIALVRTGNEASIGLLKKLGFTQNGTTLLDGKTHEIWMQ